jgi:hypothetical protein
MPSQTNMLSRKQLGWNNKRCFLRGPCRDVIRRTIKARVQVKDRPVLFREGAQHQQTRNSQTENVVLSPKWMLDTKTDWPTDRRS